MLKNVDKILNQAEALLMDEIEKRVTKILTSPKNRAQCFIMAMGMHFFSDGDGETLDDDLSYLKPVMCLFEEYNDPEYLKHTMSFFEGMENAYPHAETFDHDGLYGA